MTELIMGSIERTLYAQNPDLPRASIARAIQVLRGFIPPEVWARANVGRTTEEDWAVIMNGVKDAMAIFQKESEAKGTA